MAISNSDFARSSSGSPIGKVDVDPPSTTAVNDSDVVFTDITTGNASATKHGFLKKLSNVATEFLNGAGNFVAILKGDVGLGNVDNTSDTTKNSATATLTNKTISGSDNTITNLTRGIVNINAANFAPADATTYYFGSLEYNAPEAFANIRRLYFPVACTIKSAIFATRNSTGGSSENVTVAIRLNNTTDYNISTTSQWTTTGGYDVVSNTSINVPIAAGDFIEIKIVCPTWATNPLNCRIAATLSIE